MMRRRTEFEYQDPKPIELHEIEHLLNISLDRDIPHHREDVTQWITGILSALQTVQMHQFLGEAHQLYAQIEEATHRFTSMRIMKQRPVSMSELEELRQLGEKVVHTLRHMRGTN